MSGPIISAGNPWLEALFIVVLVSLLFVLMSPQLASVVLGLAPWLAPAFEWLRRVLD